MKRLLALVLLAPLLAVVPPTAPAQAAGSRVATLATTYTCRSPYGSGSSAARVRVRLPRTVQAGKTVARRPVRVVLTMPAELTATLRAVGVTSVSGSSSNAPLTAGAKRVAVRGLHIPRTRVPAQGALVVRGSGTVAAFRLARVGRVAVRAPRRLVVDVTGYGSGFASADVLSCRAAPGAPVRLGTLRVNG